MEDNAVPDLAPSFVPEPTDGPQEIVIRGDFITPEEQKQLLNWALTMRPHLKVNQNPARTFGKVPTLPNIPPLYRTIRLRLQDWLGVGPEAKPEPMFGWYLSIISDGGAVHTHMDPATPETRHLRCNLFLQLPEIGGFPVIEDQTHPVTERGVLAFFPSEKRHSSLAVSGARWRVICSFGYLVPKDYRLPRLPAA